MLYPHVQRHLKFTRYRWLQPDLKDVIASSLFFPNYNTTTSCYCDNMQIPPPSVRAAWPKPNYVNPVTRGSENVIVNIVLFSFLICFTGLRIFTRTHLRRAFGGDDVLILLAVVSTSHYQSFRVLDWDRQCWHDKLDPNNSFLHHKRSGGHSLSVD